MDWYTRRILQSLVVTALTISGFALTLWISNMLFPEHGCVSVKGLFWGLLYLTFFFATAFRPFFNKVLNTGVVIRNWLLCIALPTALVNICIYLVTLRICL